MDSNILIDHMNGFEQATEEIRGADDRAVSIVTWIEVLAGLPADTRDNALSLLSNFKVIPLSAEVAQETVSVRRSTRLKLPDAMVLATAHIENRVLLTRNTKDFQEGRFVRVPYRIGPAKS